MTDPRQRRTDTLRQAARRKSEAKTKTAEAAIRSQGFVKVVGCV